MRNSVLFYILLGLSVGYTSPPALAQEAYPPELGYTPPVAPPMVMPSDPAGVLAQSPAADASRDRPTKTAEPAKVESSKSVRAEQVRSATDAKPAPRTAERARRVRDGVAPATRTGTTIDRVGRRIGAGMTCFSKARCIGVQLAGTAIGAVAGGAAAGTGGAIAGGVTGAILTARGSPLRMRLPRWR
jgi:hypothetical protein